MTKTIPLKEATAAFQRAHIAEALAANGNDPLRTALALKINLSSLYAKIRRLKVQRRKDNGK